MLEDNFENPLRENITLEVKYDDYENSYWFADSHTSYHSLHSFMFYFNVVKCKVSKRIII